MSDGILDKAPGNKSNSWDEIIAEINRYSTAQGCTITVASHYSPDPDAFGSSCGLAIALQKSGLFSVTIVNEDGAARRLGWIPGVSTVVNEFPRALPKEKQLLIACDCGDRSRLGDRLAPQIREVFGRVISIDHHATNDYFGDLNQVLPTASSTSEMVLTLLEKMKTVPVTPEVAMCLYAGMAADTGSFRYSSTTEATFNAAQRLVRYGANPAQIARELFQRTSFAAMRLQALALSSMELQAAGKFAEVVVTKDMISQAGATPDDGEDLKAIAQSIDGVLVSAIIREFEDLWRVSLRAKTAAHDVSAVAEKFGGGGHKAAAAFRWKKSLSELQAALRAEMTKLVAN